MRLILTMKKQILSLLIALAVCTGAAFAQITPTLAYTGKRPKIAMDVNSSNTAEFLPVGVEESGDDVEVALLNSLFSAERQFTIKNALRNNTGGNTGYIKELYIESFDTEPVMLTRNFFVKNDKWCAVVSLSEAYYLIDEDGNNLGTLPDELFSNEQLGDIYLSGFDKGTPFWGVGDGFKDIYYNMYTFTGKAGIEPTLVSSFKSAYPNPLPAGEAFNVSLPQPADDATFFCVTDMKGRQVCRRKVTAGETTYSLTGSRFSHGHYVYTVIYGDGTTASGRLMAE